MIHKYDSFIKMLLLLVLAFTLSLTLNAQTYMVQSPGVPKSPGGETLKNAGYSYTIIPSVNNTWGYDIYLQKRLFIHQPSVPGLPGNEGFNTRIDAKKAARLVIGKIKTASARAPDSWTQKTDVGGIARQNAVGFSIGNKGYIGTGVDILTGTSNDFWEYIPLCPSPPPPTNTTPVGNLSICSGNYTTLTASGTGTLGWYDSQEGGTWLGGASPFITPILTANTTYYVQDSTDCGASATRTEITVTVNPVPPAPVITNTEDTLFSSAPDGNQWYFDGTLIAGATSQTYVATQSGYYGDVITLNGCSSDTSNTLFLFMGIDPHTSVEINVYPVPNNGRFNVSITTLSKESFSIRVYNYLGAMIREEEKLDVNGSIQKMIDLSLVPSGVYTIVFKNRQNQVVKKIIVNK